MKVENGHKVSVHYKGTLSDGTEFDNSYSRNQTLDFEIGSDAVISGFSTAVVGMSAGETKSVLLGVDDAYGQIIPEAVVHVPKSHFPKDFNFTIGNMVQGQNPDGSMAMARVAAQDGFTVTLDCNHPLAGQDLNFEIELVSINEQE